MLESKTSVQPADDEGHSYIICPKCGQKLFDVKAVEGVVHIKIKCRRCRSYIDVQLKNGTQSY